VSDRALNSTLVYREFVNPGLFIVRFKPDWGPIPDFEPGQFSSLGFPKPDSTPERVKLLRRAYSIASSPKEKETLEFFVVEVEGGALTPRLKRMEIGERIWMDPKIMGHFTLKPVPPGKDLVCVSTGTGLAPFISMLRTFRGTGRWRKMVILHGVRKAEDLGYREELEQAAREDPSVIYVPSATRDPGWGGREGRLNALLEPAVYRELTGEELNPEQTHVFLCGNPEMIRQMQADLESRGFQEYSERKCPTGTIHLERYW
jgi:ferredoxin--NADP+ reductase